jgi:hypothetical protein
MRTRGFEDFDLLPGEPVEIKVRSAVTLDELKNNLKVVSLVDVFVPGSTGPVASGK